MPRHHISLFGLSLTVFLLAVALSSCASRHTAAILNDVDTYIQQRPDSALATIRAIDTTTLTTRSLRAHYALLYAIALDKNWIDTTDVNVVMPAVEYYDRHPSGIRRAKAWYYLGRIQQNGDNRPDASISFLKAERYAESSDDSDFKGLIALAMSSIYSQTHLHEEALMYSERARSFFLGAKDTLNANAALFSTAQEYYNLGRYDEADSLFRFFVENRVVHPNLRSELLCTYALSCIIPGEDYQQAVYLFEKVLASRGSLINANYWGAYAYALLRSGNTDQANRIFSQLAMGGSNSQTFVYDSWKSMADAYENNYISAYALQKSASDIQNENVKQAFRRSAIKAQKDFLEQVNQETEKSAKRRQIVAWSLVALLLAVTVLLIFLIRRRKERSAQEKEELMDAYKSLTMEHSALNTRYSDLSAQIDRIEKEKASVRNKYIQLCQSHFGRIGRINEVLYYHSREKDNELYKELKRAIRNIGMDNKSISEFELLLNETFDNVMAHFREVFPDKKPRYYQLVSYLFAGFGSSTICAIIPGFQKHNVHVERYRLKQMIQDSDSQYSEQFLGLLS